MNRPRREDETYEEYKANLKKEDKEQQLKLNQGTVFHPNRTFQSINGKIKIMPSQSLKKPKLDKKIIGE